MPTIKGGLSSSAALECATLANLADLNDLEIEPRGLLGRALAAPALLKKGGAAFERLAAMPPTAELHELLAEVKTLEGRNDEAILELVD